MLEKKFLVKDLYVITVHKVTNIDIYENAGIFDSQGRVKAKPYCYIIGYKRKGNDKHVYRCLTEVKYPIFEKMSMCEFVNNGLIVSEENIVNFYDFYDDAVDIFLKNGKDPANIKMSLKKIAEFENNLNDKLKSMNENKTEKDYE